MAELIKVNAPVRKPLFEGVQGENEARSIQFDITPWVDELGSGVVTATAKRSQDSQPYPVTITVDGTTATWKPTSTDTAFAGVGSFQLEYTVDSVLAKTCIWSTMVAPSLDPAGDPPDPYDNWLAEMRGIEASVIQNAQDAEDDADRADAAADAAAQSASESAGDKSGKKYPVFINTMPFFWPGGQSTLAAQVTDDATARTYYFEVSGSAGDSILTIESGSPLTVNDLTANDPRRGVLVSGDICEAVSVMRDGSGNFTVYPALSETVSNARIYSMGVGIHLTQQGYTMYTRNFYGMKKKYCDKSRYLAMYSPYIDPTNTPNPLTKIGSFWWGEGAANPIAPTKRTVENFTMKYLNMYFNTAGTPSNTVGAEWEVDLDYKKGYVEVLMGADVPTQRLVGELPAGMSVNIEMYLDGVLSQTVTKTTTKAESICLDFGGASKGKLRITTNSGVTGFSVPLSQIVWWVSDIPADEPAIDPFGSVVMLMDSWGVYADNAVPTEYARLVGLDANGMSVPLVNKSVGSKTSAWGCERFYADAWVEHPAYVLMDFGINDVNLGVTKQQYIDNMTALANAALANNITPVFLLVGWSSTGGIWNHFTLPFIESYAEDVSE